MLFESTGEIRVPIKNEYYLTGSRHTLNTPRGVTKSVGDHDAPRVILRPVKSPWPAGTLEPVKSPE